jgi:hypothetical protein
MHTLAPDNSIIGLKRLSGKENCRPETLNVGREMENEVNLRLVEPMWGPADHLV